MTQYFSPLQVAQKWAMSRSEIYKLIKEGKLGVLRIGSALRISQSTIEAFERTNHTSLIDLGELIKTKNGRTGNQIIKKVFYLANKKGEGNGRNKKN